MRALYWAPVRALPCPLRALRGEAERRRALSWALLRGVGCLAVDRGVADLPRGVADLPRGVALRGVADLPRGVADDGLTPPLMSSDDEL